MLDCKTRPRAPRTTPCLAHERPPAADDALGAFVEVLYIRRDRDTLLQIQFIDFQDSSQSRAGG